MRMRALFSSELFVKEMYMNRKSLIFIIWGIILLLAVAFWVGRTSAASTGCFPDTNGHWAETFICWLKDNSISGGYPDGTYKPENNVTRAEMAVMLQKQAEVPPTTGAITISPPNNDWEVYGGMQDYVSIYTSLTDTVAINSVTGMTYLHLFPTLPNILYGRRMRLMGVEFCYGASTTAVLNYVEVYTLAKSGTSSSYQPHLKDSTARTDHACRYYVLPAVVFLTAEDMVGFEVDVNWVSAGAWFSLDRTTFVLQPSANIAVVPSALSENAVLLTQGPIPVP
jgi:S-layer homology domain